jgi:hypothetical protein
VNEISVVFEASTAIDEAEIEIARGAAEEFDFKISYISEVFSYPTV